MRIGIVGGTGNMGRGLAVRFVKRHIVMIGSRRREKAEETARSLMKYAKGFYQSEMEGEIHGCLNRDAMEAEIVFITLPPKAVIPTLKGASLNKEQIVVSTVVSMERRGKLYHYQPLKTGMSSASEVIQELVKPAKVVAAFQTIPAVYLYNLDAIMNLDVLMAGDDEATLTIVSRLVREIPNLRPLRCGPLENSRWIEALTPLLLNAAILNGLHEPSIRIIPWLPE